MKGILRSQRDWCASNQPLALGCSSCSWLSLCGGLRVPNDVFDCLSYCDCQKPSRCEFVCQSDNRRFVSRVREVQTLSLDNIERVPAIVSPQLPMLIPQLYHGSKRQALTPPAVAIALSMLLIVGLASQYLTHESLAEAFDSMIVLHSLG